jgi:hypothetical protein
MSREVTRHALSNVSHIRGALYLWNLEKQHFRGSWNTCAIPEDTGTTIWRKQLRFLLDYEVNLFLFLLGNMSYMSEQLKVK